MKWFFLGSFISISFWTDAQINVVTGRVVNANSVPIVGANVFLANTTFGGSTNIDGQFSFLAGGNAKHVLVVTVIGYEHYETVIDFSDQRKFELAIQLAEAEVKLPDLTVREDTTTRAKYVADFKNLFIGVTSNAKRCKLVNPSALHVYFDPDQSILYAHSREPLKVENRALGYNVFFTIKEFQFDYGYSTLVFNGIIRFDVLKAKSESELRRWTANRKEAFRGSFNHFMRCLLANRLDKEGFVAKRIYQVKDVKNPGHLIDSAEKKKLKGKELLDEGTNTISYKGSLQVLYTRSPEQPRYALLLRSKTKGSQQSNLIFSGKPIFVYHNGAVDDPTQIITKGYWSWTNKIAEALPYDYEYKFESDK